MTGKADGHAELRRVAAIFDAWAENIRADAAPGNGHERTERSEAMADVLATAAAALRAAPSDHGLAAAICAANAIRADGVPRGFDLAQVYTDGHEVVVCGEPAPDAMHDCTEMGCGANAHVIYRTTCDPVNGMETPEGRRKPIEPVRPEDGVIDTPETSTD